ncbi:MAG: PLP-dependent aminotransferase family protein [Polyangiaceae bacterium]
MTPRTPLLDIELEGGPEGFDTPVYLRIARAVERDVRRGRLRPGDRMPGSRTLADALGVNRNTVVAAYRELEGVGWLTTTEARGTFVSSSIAERPPRPIPRKGRAPRLPPTGIPEMPAFPLRAEEGRRASPRSESESGTARVPGRTSLPLLGGIPDLRLAPWDAFARAHRRVVRTRAPAAFAYGDPRGAASLRQALARMLRSTRAVLADDDSLLVTRGTQMALHLVSAELFAAGDAVAVEGFGYRPAWDTFRAAGADVVPVPLDEEGIDVHALVRAHRERPFRAVYVTPHHQFPTTRPLSAARRLALLAFASDEKVAVIEDDYDHEFHYDGRPIAPLASADPAGVVVYVGTLSKVFAPGLRVGYVVAPKGLVARLVRRRVLVDRQGDHAGEAALADLMEDGTFDRHVGRVRRAYAERRSVLVAALAKTLGSALTFTVPPGGTALWARASRGIDVDAWVRRAEDGGVRVHAGRRFAFDGRPRPFLRVGFAPLGPAEILEAVRRLGRSLGPIPGRS